jgi:glutathione S-transferase
VEIPLSEWFAPTSEHKKQLPLGQVPVLFVDGRPLAQTAAIGHYLGQTFGL